jgi:hypothetical protein
VSHPPVAGTPRIVSATSRPPLRFRGWPVWGWLVLVLAALATLVFEGYVLFWLAFGMSGEPPAPETVIAVQDGARRLTLTLIVPWALAAILLRPRLRVVLTALMCITPAIWFWWDVGQTA